MVIPGALDGERLDRVVSLLCDLTRREAAALVAAGGVRVGGHPVTNRSSRVAQGDDLDIDRPPPTVPFKPWPQDDVEVPVVHVDEHVIVVDKPAGLVVHPGAGQKAGTLVNGLLATYPEIATVGAQERPGIVHRLDKGTSGLLVVARTPMAYDSLVGQLSARSVERRYLALVWGRFESAAGAVDAPVGRGSGNPTRMAVSAGGRPARTSYRVLQLFTQPAKATLVACRLETGRTHQVRVHLAAIGHPVVGDDRYGGARPSIDPGRPFLHASQLGFDHPATGERLRFTSALPPELEKVLGSLR
ncbi:MAG: rRNA synthase [Actinomycetota bacterium]|jgi:23S rRNA pseudouridine1911/1915/1917 synthase|nr:rRNA synthase [Actinomycetota bacterium]MEA2933294.1 rRNA synthase [Actinomycetota bacterium]